MFKNIARLIGIVTIFAISTVNSSADTKLQDGTILSDKPTFIVTYIEAAVGMEEDVAALIRDQTGRP